MSVATVDELRRTSVEDALATENAAHAAWERHKRVRREVLRGTGPDGRKLTETEVEVALAQLDAERPKVAQAVEDAKAATLAARVAAAQDRLPDALAAWEEGATQLLADRGQAERSLARAIIDLWALEDARLAEMQAARVLAAVAREAAPDDRAREQVRFLLRSDPGEVPVAIDTGGPTDYRTRPAARLWGSGRESMNPAAGAFYDQLAELVRVGRDRGLPMLGDELRDTFAAVEREGGQP